MYYRIVAPPSFFDSPDVPPVCLLTGRSDRLQPTDLDLSFVRAGPLRARHRGHPVNDLVTEAAVLKALSGHTRKTRQNILLTVPMQSGALFGWRLHTGWIPNLLLLSCPLAAMSAAGYWPELQKLNWVLGAVFAGLVAGLLLSWMYRRLQPPRTEFQITTTGYVAVLLPEYLRPAAEQLQAGLDTFLVSQASAGTLAQSAPAVPPAALAAAARSAGADG